MKRKMKKRDRHPRYAAISNRRFAVLMMDAGFEGPIWRAVGRAIDGMDQKNTPFFLQDSWMIEEARKRSQEMKNPPVITPD